MDPKHLWMLRVYGGKEQYNDPEKYDIVNMCEDTVVKDCEGRGLAGIIMAHNKCVLEMEKENK